MCIFIPLGYEIIALVLFQVTFRYCYWLKQNGNLSLASSVCPYAKEDTEKVTPTFEFTKGFQIMP